MVGEGMNSVGIFEDISTVGTRNDGVEVEERTRTGRERRRRRRRSCGLSASQNDDETSNACHGSETACEFVSGGSASVRRRRRARGGCGGNTSRGLRLSI